jgi:hypothetical protein
MVILCGCGWLVPHFARTTIGRCRDGHSNHWTVEMEGESTAHVVCQSIGPDITYFGAV